MSETTLDMSRKAIENGQRLDLAFFMSVDNTKTASIVLLPCLNPNCSGPSIPFSSASLDMIPDILTVRRRRRFDGIVMGRYCAADKESPPWKT